MWDPRDTLIKTLRESRPVFYISGSERTQAERPLRGTREKLASKNGVSDALYFMADSVPCLGICFLQILSASASAFPPASASFRDVLVSFRMFLRIRHHLLRVDATAPSQVVH